MKQAGIEPAVLWFSWHRDAIESLTTAYMKQARMMDWLID